MEKFCLEWKDFESNIREYFKKQREDESSFDVTLASEDGHEIKAHKFVLSAGSDFFSGLFLRNNHPNMYIFLKGVSRSQLEHVANFLYYGEASVTKNEMKVFFGAAKLLQVKGLQGEELEPELEFEDNNKIDEVVVASLNSIDNSKTNVDSLNFLVDSAKDEQNPGGNAYKDLDHQITEMIENTENGKLKCTVCGKIATQHLLRRHAEIHIEGLSFTCHVCGKSCSTRQYLRQHISNNHTGGVFSCNVCNKTGMNRNAYHVHKNIYHKKQENYL